MVTFNRPQHKGTESCCIDFWGDVGMDQRFCWCTEWFNELCRAQ